jgi:hypothetical protein
MGIVKENKMNTKQKALLIASLVLLLAGAALGQQRTPACYAAQSLEMDQEHTFNILYKLEAKNSVSNPDFASLVEAHIVTLQADMVNVIATCEIKDQNKASKHFMASGKKYVADLQATSTALKQAAGL